MAIRRMSLLAGCFALGLLGAVDPGWCADNLIFVPLPPCRVINTLVSGAGGPLVAGSPRTFVFRGPTLNYQNPTPFPNQGGNTTGCGIPDLTTDTNLAVDPGGFQNIAKAVAINIVAVGPSGAGDLRAWPANQSVPLASVINYAAVAGLNIANGVIVPMCDQVSTSSPCASGDITFRADVSGTNLVVDVVGYFHAGSTVFTVSNTALGHQALQANTTGFRNTASGGSALYSNTTGYSNTASGNAAMFHNTTGFRNTASGDFALEQNTTGSHNTATGSYALFFNTTGANNTASGYDALLPNTGDLNTASGAYALGSNTTGSTNTASGANALFVNTTGSRNVGIGYRAGYNATTGSDNIFISHQGVAADSATIRIGSSGTQLKTFIAGIVGTTTGNNDAVAVFVDSAGQLGTTSSSLRFKQDIEDVGAASDRILNLRPVKFRYKEQAARGDATPQFGLIAEEVAQVFPELVVYDKEGQPETVKYHLLVPLLLGELQKQQSELVDAKKFIQEQNQLNQRQQSELAEQRSLIQELLRRMASAPLTAGSARASPP